MASQPNLTVARLPPSSTVSDEEGAGRPSAMTMGDIDALARRLSSYDVSLLSAHLASDVRLAALVIRRLRAAYHASDVISLCMM